jgi:hypothetical protein
MLISLEKLKLIEVLNFNFVSYFMDQDIEVILDEIFVWIFLGLKVLLYNSLMLNHHNNIVAFFFYENYNILDKSFLRFLILD